MRTARKNEEERNVRKLNHLPLSVRVPIEADNPSIVRWEEKCIRCGMCKEACTNLMGVHGTYTLEQTGGKAICIYCGQCANVCPVDSITERDESPQVQKAIADPDKVVVVSTSPSVRAALGEEFGMEPGAFVEGKMVALLRALGVDYVLDTNFAADLTIIEEGFELVDRIQHGGALPMMTSCSTAWIKFCEYYYPELLPNLSTAKSPQQMYGASVKTYYAKKFGIDPKDIYVVSVMPCIAKKFEKTRPYQDAAGVPDIDAVLTTRELARMIKRAGIQYNLLPDEKFDEPLGVSTGAGVIFGATGGVMEAALRTVADLLEGKELEDFEYKAVRGQQGIKSATVTLGGKEIKIAVASSLANARVLMDEIKAGNSPYQFIEIMSCPGGCVNGGGQPIHDAATRQRLDIPGLRAKAIYANDKACTYRKSYKNPAVMAMYEEYLEKPGSERAHHILHTKYIDRTKK